MISDFAPLPAAIASLVATTETAIIVNVLDAGAGTGNQPQGRVVRGYVAFTTGATGGLMTLRVRQGSGTGGTAIGTTATTVVATVAATTQYVMPYCLQDLSGAQLTAYTLTATVTGSNASIQDANCEVAVPDPFGAQ